MSEPFSGSIPSGHFQVIAFISLPPSSALRIAICRSTDWPGKARSGFHDNDTPKAGRTPSKNCIV